MHVQDSTRYEKTQKLLEKYDPDYEAPTPRKPPPPPLPRQATPGPATPLPHQVHTPLAPPGNTACRDPVRRPALVLGRRMQDDPAVYPGSPAPL